MIASLLTLSYGNLIEQFNWEFNLTVNSSSSNVLVVIRGH